LQKALADWHKVDEDAAKKCGDSEIVAHCEELYFKQADIDKIDEYKSEATEKAKAHRECRINRAAKCTSSACTQYDDYRKTSPQALLPICVKDQMKEEFITTSDDTDLQTMESCLGQTKTRWLDPLWDYYSACKRDGEDCLKDCQHDQLYFEEHMCSFGQFQEQKCDDVDVCKADESTKCDDTCAGMENRVALRKSDDETGERLKCLLEVLFGKWNGDAKSFGDVADDKKDGLTTCKNKQYDEYLEKWELECPIVQHANNEVTDVQRICATSLDLPCTDEFLTKFYILDGLNHACQTEECDEKTNGLEKKIDKCTACPSTTEVGVSG